MTTLKTFPTHQLSKEMSLKALLQLLSYGVDKNLICILSKIGKTLHSSNTVEEVQPELMKLYTSEKLKLDLLTDQAKNNPTILYHRCSLKLIDELLRIKPIQTGINIYTFGNVSPDTRNSSVILPPSLNTEYNFLDKLFLLANTIIYHLEGEMPSIKKEDYSEKNKIFYSRQDIDGSIAIGRSYIYEHPGLSTKLATIDIDVKAYMKAIFMLCAHMESYPYIAIEIPTSIQSFPRKSQQILSLYLPKLTMNIQSFQWSFEEVLNNLHKLYFTDHFCCEKPLIIVDGKYYSLQPKFLWASLVDLPYYMLLNACNKIDSCVKHLGGLWGKAFEFSFQKLSERAFGLGNCDIVACKENYPKLNVKKGHYLGDYLISPDENTRILVEFKGAMPTNPIKQGNRSQAFSKFINLKNNEGVPQLIRDAEIYRQESGYNGDLYIIFVCRGPVPLTTDFDTDLKSYLNSLKDYQKYIKSDLNRPLIYLDALLAEFLFSAIAQGIPAMSLIPSLAGLSPSKVLPVIRNKIQEHGFKQSFQPLYSEEVENMSCAGKSMFDL